MNYFRNYGRIADGKTSVEVAWELCQKHPEIREDFDGQAKTYKWEGVQFAPDSPFWAYWFARNVIKDEWLPGEDVILKDQGVWKTYVQYTLGLKDCGILGHTLREDPDFVVDRYGVIKGWKPGRGPVTGGGKMAKRTTLAERFGNGATDAAAIADRIAEQMQDFKKKRKLRADTPELGDDSDED